MFHTYVLAHSGNVVDFGRASLLMDRNLLAKSIRAMIREQNTCPRWDAHYGAQWVWDYYCQRHYERFGIFFVPNVDPSWDRRKAAAVAPQNPQPPDPLECSAIRVLRGRTPPP
jgi:hypothetical protein